MIQKLYIRNMVCTRCIKVVRQILLSLDFDVQEIQLGLAKVNDKGTNLPLIDLDKKLKADGFELISDRSSIISEQVKHALILQVDHLLHHEKVGKLSVYLSEKVGMEYSQISKTFSQVEGLTINSYFIKLKLEKVKELIQYGEMSFKEIAYTLGYSSLQHLSGQFKRVHGVSMTDFNALKQNIRGPIDGIL